MTTLAMNHLLHGVPALLHRLGQGLSAMFQGVSDARSMADEFKTLSRMSDAELARYGLKREDIPRAVLAGRTRR